MGDRIDKDGNVYTERWDGQYRPESTLFGTKQNKDFWGNANIERDWLGNAKVETDWLGNPKRAADGRPLYIPKGGSSSSSGGGGLVGCLLILALVLLLGAIMLLVLPFFHTLWRLLKERDGRTTLLITVGGLISLSVAGLVGQWSFPGVFAPYYALTMSPSEWINPELGLFGWLAAAISVLLILWACFVKDWLGRFFSATGTLMAVFVQEIGRGWNTMRGWL